MSSGFKEKLKNLPEEIKRLFTSEKSAEFNVLLCQKHKIVGKEAVKKFLLVLSSLFFKEIPLSDLVAVLQKEFNFSPEAAKALALDIAGYRLLSVKDWLRDDVAAYIKSLGGKAEDYLKYVEENKQATKEEYDFYEQQDKEVEIKDTDAMDQSVDLEASAGYQFDLNKEKGESEEIFKNSLIDFLEAGEEFFVEEYNVTLLRILIDGGLPAKNDLEKALYANQERLTSAPFNLDKKAVAATVGNWLKDFLAVKGSGQFDNIAISDFLIKSQNALNLNDAERIRLRKLLVLYRNLKFFPESMPNNTGDGWEIIPTQVGEEAMQRAKIEKVQTDTENEVKIAELRVFLGKYPEGSLARKAVEEEMKKYKQKT